MAWDLFADPVGARFVNAYLHHDRGIDVKALETANGGPLAGRAGSGWTRLVDQLIRRGVTPEELRAVDLAQFTRHGSLIDTLRDRVVLPIRIRDGRIAGFIGRDVSGDPRAPKYRNLAHTPVFDKSLTLYRPILVARHPEATVVVVEGPLDAPAIAATAADAGLTDRVIPVSANGTAVSGPQAAQVCALAPAGIVLALDGDDAGRAGTERWLDALTLQRHRLPRVAALPDRVDPAGWLAERGRAGLAAFGANAEADDAAGSRPRMPGRELVRACLPRARNPIRDTAHDSHARQALTVFADNSRHADPWAAQIYADARAWGYRHPRATRVLARVLARGWVRTAWQSWYLDALSPRAPLGRLSLHIPSAPRRFRS